MSRLTRRSLPPYSYVPGQFPHPRSHPQGHSFGKPEPDVDSFAPEAWKTCDEYLFGCDLLNQSFYWEAHEQWEAVWLSLGRSGVVADLMKGLIKIAAMGVKARQANVIGFERHKARAVQLFCAVREKHSRLAGLELDQLINDTKSEDGTAAVQESRLAMRVLPIDP